MKIKTTAMIVGAMLAITSATLPAFAQTKVNVQSPANSAVTKTTNLNTKWRLDETGAKVYKLTQEEQQNFDKFKNAINQGLSPKAAAQKISNARFARVKGLKNQYVIRLSKNTPVIFQVNPKDQLVKIRQVGLRK
jgi:Spy/CpxP family protein refolding chaperone